MDGLIGQPLMRWGALGIKYCVAIPHYLYVSYINPAWFAQRTPQAPACGV
jgi:hypothetical protein